MKTDAQVQHDVLAELNWEPSINAAGIGVEVSDGVVTLAGHVASFAEKWDAERVAQRVAGVQALAVEIEVTLPGSSVRSDSDIARSAVHALEWSTYVPRDAVKVLVEGGHATLSGEVDWEYQRQAAASGVRSLMGVTGISDQIALKPKASVPAIKADIEAALKRGAKLDAARVAVHVEGGVVTLSGPVHSWPERYLARNAAWAGHGVCRVIDNMTVSG